jgi:tRNA threonylcarbamoyladenosine biosynthesis protein TsaB
VEPTYVKLLAIDTATELCSAALWLDGVLSTRDCWAPRAHGALILPMVEQLLSEAQLAGTRLEAIAFGRGPGAFTGLRLAAAIAQGLGFAWELPLIAISDLRALAAQPLPPQQPGRALVCQDARMHEVYWACFERGARDPLRLLGEEAVSAPGAVVLPQEWTRSHGHAPGANVTAVGSGFAVYPELQSRLQDHLGDVRPDLRPHAREIAALAAEAGLSAALSPDLAEPVYLRNHVASSS